MVWGIRARVRARRGRPAVGWAAAGAHLHGLLQGDGLLSVRLEAFRPLRLELLPLLLLLPREVLELPDHIVDELLLLLQLLLLPVQLLSILVEQCGVPSAAHGVLDLQGLPMHIPLTVQEVLEGVVRRGTGGWGSHHGIDTTSSPRGNQEGIKTVSPGGNGSRACWWHV